MWRRTKRPRTPLGSDGRRASTVSEDIDPRRALWRRRSYEIVGDWLAPASVLVLDRAEDVIGGSLVDRRVLDLAAGTGNVAIEAARRGASVTGVDATDELLDVARRRAAGTGVDVRFEVGDFDRLDEAVGDERFDVVTSAFGVIFAPPTRRPRSSDSGRRLDAGGVVSISGWDPDGVFVVPEPILDLLPDRGAMPDMATWTTRIDELCGGTLFVVAATHSDDLDIDFASVEDAAEQLERWSGGWSQLFDVLGRCWGRRRGPRPLPPASGRLLCARRERHRTAGHESRERASSRSVTASPSTPDHPRPRTVHRTRSSGSISCCDVSHPDVPPRSSAVSVDVAGGRGASASCRIRALCSTAARLLSNSHGMLQNPWIIPSKRAIVAGTPCRRSRSA